MITFYPQANITTALLFAVKVSFLQFPLKIFTKIFFQTHSTSTSFLASLLGTRYCDLNRHIFSWKTFLKRNVALNKNHFFIAKKFFWSLISQIESFSFSITYLLKRKLKIHLVNHQSSYFLNLSIRNLQKR